MTGSFDDKGIVVFTETEKKPVDPKRFQAAMFMDRADLWKKAGPKHPAPYDPAQLTLFAYKLVKDVASVYSLTLPGTLLRNGNLLIRICILDDGWHLVMAVTPRAEYVTHQMDMAGICFYGNYFDSEASANADFNRRAGGYNARLY
jgi:hypothetical protein